MLPESKQNHVLMERAIFILKTVAIILMLISIYRWLDHRLVNYFFIDGAVKDELQFVDYFNFYLTNGYYESVARGSSPVYNILTHLFYLVNDDVVMDMRIINVAAMLGMVMIWQAFLFGHLKLDKKYFVVMGLFLLQLALMRSAAFTGGNDVIFVFVVSLAIIYLFKGILHAEKRNNRIFLAALFFALSMGIREWFFLYIPGIVLVLFLSLVLKRITVIQAGAFITAFVLVSIVIHFPAIIEHGSISIHNKDLAVPHTWSERGYLQILKGQHDLPPWEEVTEYKRLHGENSLPKSYYHAVLWDPMITIKNYFHQFYWSILPFIRQLGLLYPLYFVAVLVALWKREFTSGIVNGFLLYSAFTLCFCIIVIYRVEFKWFMMFPFLITVYGVSYLSQLFKKYPLAEIMLYVNLIVLGLANALLIGIW